MYQRAWRSVHTFDCCVGIEFSDIAPYAALQGRLPSRIASSTWLSLHGRNIERPVSDTASGVIIGSPCTGKKYSAAGLLFLLNDLPQLLHSLALRGHKRFRFRLILLKRSVERVKLSRRLCIQKADIFAPFVLLHRNRVVLCQFVLPYACQSTASRPSYQKRLRLS